MFSSFSRGLAATTVAIMASMNVLSASAAGFDAYYQGNPDLVFNVIQQKSATSFAFTICNQGDVSTGKGTINIALQSNEGQSDDRDYQNMTIPSGSCIALTMYSVDGYKTALKRKSAITGTVRFDGTRRELRTNNNQITLAAKKSRADISDLSYVPNTTSTSSNATVDIWGDNETKWYTSNNSYNNGNYYNNTNCPSNSIYANCTSGNSSTVWYNNNGNTNYNGTYYNGAGTNGDIRPASPTWAMQQGNQNLVFVYTGYNTGTWYNYAPSSNGNYSYTPYTNPSVTTNSSYTRTNTYNTFESNPPTSTNQYHIYDINTGYVPASGNNPNANYDYSGGNNVTNYTNGTYYNNGNPNTFAPGNYNSNCPQWVKVWNTGNQAYEWTCSSNYVQPTGNPDLYLANLKQNGGRSELVGKICNQGDSMTVSRQVTVRATNSQYNTTAATFVQLLKGGCSDITIPTANLNFNWFAGTNYLVYAEVDIYNNVQETREDNNASYWRIQIQ